MIVITFGIKSLATFAMTSPNYPPDIEGLRAVVLHYLSAPFAPGGYVGVDVIFVISRYLIPRIISREMEEDTFTFARYYDRRVPRILPALFVQNKGVAVRFYSPFTSCRLLADALLAANLSPLIYSQNWPKLSFFKKLP